MNPILKGLRGTVIAVAVAGLVQSVGSIALGPFADASSSQMTATTAVNVRAGASTGSARVGILYRGERVQAVSASNGWTAVTHRGTTAYVASAYLTSSSVVVEKPSTSQPTGNVFAVATLNLRAGPSLADTVSQVVTKGTKLGLTGTISGSYSQVAHNGRTLWAATSYLAASVGAPTQSLPAVTGKVRATAALMIRTTGDRNFTSLGDVPTGTLLDVTGVVSNGLAQVVWQGNVRWVNNSYVTKVSGSTTSPVAPAPPKTSTQYATANLNVWHAATGTAHSGEIGHGSAVAVTGVVTSGRAQIVVSGAVRWVTAKYLSASKPSATPGGGTGGGGSLNHGFSSGLDQTNANVKNVVRHIWANYPAIKTMYGWRRDVTPDHPAGRAVDVMIPNYRSNSAQGWEIARYFRANAKQFGISYIIFDQQIWSVARDKEGWRKMAGRGGDTANHKDHVHINTHG
ncbi:SH3 domain-containing protein [Tessaracoccus antarcticus]|uniref:SH3 domain-containing protein n=1 Tax=Tessaracoccus antarcticus TaxID=2479848 RepID=UPI00131478E6|nr:SH3 domain-containing protein [Tessaracoccus antarcticus]